MTGFTKQSKAERMKKTGERASSSGQLERLGGNESLEKRNNIMVPSQIESKPTPFRRP